VTSITITRIRTITITTTTITITITIVHLNHTIWVAEWVLLVFRIKVQDSILLHPVMVIQVIRPCKEGRACKECLVCRVEGW
jgi:hypothetical protein